MNNLKRRIQKIEQARAIQQIEVILVNDIELQSKRSQGLPHDPFITLVNGCKIIHCLQGQNIDGL
jgi:hypothetical protein